jgi:hypothetical protein
MKNRDYILNELREISPVVAQIGGQNLYTVPAGYFEGLADQMLQLIKADEGNTPVLPQTINPYQVPQGYFDNLANELLKRVKADEVTSPLLQQAKNNPYQVPADYFEGLTGQILQRIKADEVTLSPALQQANNNPYEIPQGYFDSLPATILNRIKAEQTDNASQELEMLSPLLSRIGKSTPFSMPAGYFDELSENAVAGAQAIEFVNGELENLSPLMISLRNKQVYQAPAGYFEQLPEQILNTAKAQQPAKVVSINFARRVMRYAAAAVVAGIIGVAGWMHLGHRNAITPDTPPIAHVQKQLDSVSDEVLEKYLENQATAPAETAAVVTNTIANGEIDTSDMKDMLADVSDEDLQQYLEKYGSTVNKDVQTN